MKLVIDENIVYASEAFSSFGNMKLINGRSLVNEDIKDADVLIVRSVTDVNEKLLKNTNIKFVGTATIGTDHIDLDYLNKHEIQFADAKGCNADSVAEYVFTALLKITSEKNISLRDKSIGVVGVGNIGSRVERLAESFGMRVLKNDPPLERKRIGNSYTSLNKVLKADIITFHVPMHLSGPDKTFHLLNKNNLDLIKNGAIIINTSRGSVIDNNALFIEWNKKDFELILDVWENEPAVNNELLLKTKIATSHIAGYSFEGKVNGTEMIYNSLCKYLNREPVWSPSLPRIEKDVLTLPPRGTIEERLYRLFSSIYNIEKDDELMRKITYLELKDQPAYFDSLRKKYPIRREFNNFTVILEEKDKHFKSILESLRFNTKII